MATENNLHDNRRPKSRANWVLLGFLAIIAYFLFMEHRVHALSILPWLLLLACPLLHLFMHGGHGGHGGHGQGDQHQHHDKGS